jgi:hypothetical protein
MSLRKLDDVSALLKAHLDGEAQAGFPAINADFELGHDPISGSFRHTRCRPTEPADFGKLAICELLLAVQSIIQR